MSKREKTLKVTCWCESNVVRVPVSKVRMGITRSCGKPECFDPRKKGAG